MTSAMLTRPTTGSDLCRPRWATPRNPDRQTYGGRVAQIAEALGTPLMPWQRYVADVALEVDPATGLLAYQTVVLTIPRQQGKTTLILPVWVHRATQWPDQSVVWTMQNALAARKKWQDEHVPILKKSPLWKTVERDRRQPGAEAVMFKNGSIQQLVAGTKSAGHGMVVDLAVVDEAFAYPDDRMQQAMRPAMRTRKQPQMWLVSTMGTAESTWFHGWCDAGRAAVESGKPGPVAYFEWSADEDADPADPTTWWSCMPALGHTVTEDAIRSEYEQAMMTPDGLSGFRRASLNQRTHARVDPVFPPDVWAAAADPTSTIDGPLVLAVDMPPDRAWVTLAVGGRRPDGLTHVEVVDRRRGTGWISAEVARLLQVHDIRHVLLSAGGPAGGVLPDVQDGCRQARPGDAEVLRLVTGGEFTSSCGRFFDLVTGDGLRHLGQDELDVAIAAAARRATGDAWRWARQSTDVDISPLCAVSMAAWAVDALPTVVVPSQSTPFVLVG